MSELGDKSFDWPALMQAGMHHLRLPPREFWRLTPAELQLMLGLSKLSAHAPMDRQRLLNLQDMYPDARAQCPVKKEGADHHE